MPITHLQILALLLILPTTLQQTTNTPSTDTDQRRFIIGLIFIALIVLILIISVVVALCCCQDREQNQNQFQQTNMRLQIEYLTRKVDSEDHETNTYLNNLKHILQKVKNSSSQMTHTQMQVQHFSINFSYTIERDKSPGTWSIVCSGSDNIFGKWMAKGQFFMVAPKPFLWLSMQYQNREAAGQTGVYRTIIYESTHQTPESILGQWSYEGFQGIQYYSGPWGMIQTGFSSPPPLSSERGLSGDLSI